MKDEEKTSKEILESLVKNDKGRAILKDIEAERLVHLKQLEIANTKQIIVTAIIYKFKDLMTVWVILSFALFAIYNKFLLSNKMKFGFNEMINQIPLLIYISIVAYSISIIFVVPSLVGTVDNRILKNLKKVAVNICLLAVLIGLMYMYKTI